MTEPGGSRKQALVLSGGGVRGAYQAGAIEEILQPKYGFRPNAIYGISVGSINGGILASYIGQQFVDRPTLEEPSFESAGKKLREFWETDITDHTKIAKARSPFLVALEVIFKNYHGMLNVSKSVQIMRKEIQHKNLQLAADKADLKFYAGTLNLSTGRYIDAPQDDAAIVDYVIASAMAPVVMPMKVIPEDNEESSFERWKSNLKEWWDRRKKDHVDRDECWIDGGIRNIVPVSAAVEEGYDDVVCVLCRPEKIEKGSFQGRLGKTSKRVSDIVAQLTLEDDVQWAQDLKDWMDSLGGALDLMTKEQRDKYKGNTKFENYRNLRIRVVRPTKKLDFEAETLEKGGVKRMVGEGREDAKIVMTASLSPPASAAASSSAVPSGLGAGGI